MDISSNGQVIVGAASTPVGVEAFRWSAAEGMVGLGYLPGITPQASTATGVSDTGDAIVGWTTSTFGYEAFLWRQSTGFVPLGVVPGFNNSYALACSGNASTIIGFCDSAFASQAFVWTLDFGIEPLQERLMRQGATGLEGWTLLSATGVSAGGM